MGTRLTLPDWNALAAQADETVPLLETALLIARDEYPDLDAAGYADQVPAPTDETLRAFYEKYKYLPNSASSEMPGFYLPTKAALEVVHASLTEERLAAVTDAEIAAFYEANREQFKKPAQQPTPNASGALPAENLTLPGVDGGIAPLPEDALTGSPVISEPTPAEEEKPAEAAPSPAP